LLKIEHIDFLLKIENIDFAKTWNIVFFPQK